MINEKYYNDLKFFFEKHIDIIDGIHLFGSSLYKNSDNANDIDIAIIVRNRSLRAFKNIVDTHDFLLNVRCASANGDYSGGGGERNSLDYHFVLLDKDHLNERFLELNPDMKQLF